MQQQTDVNEDGYTNYHIIDTICDYDCAPIYNDSTKYRLHKYGGHIYLYMIYCSNKLCGSELFKYQKDGLGPLLRCYSDRIIKNINLKTETHSESIADIIGDKLICNTCGNVISDSKSIYTKKNVEYNHSENRESYELQKS